MTMVYLKVNQQCTTLYKVQMKRPAIYFTQMYHNGKLNGMTYEYDKKGKNIIRRARYRNGICMADTIISDKGITYKYREYESEYMMS